MVIVISINIYKSIKTLEHQLKTIEKNVKAPYVVILNCNNYMYDTLSKNQILDKNIYLNPEIIEKKRYHGSLTQGIVSNMKYALDNFEFKYFLVISGRTIFYRPITIEILDVYFKTKKWSSLEEMKKVRSGQFTTNEWKWESLKQTKLAKYYIDNNYTLICEAHEGICFSYNVTKNIVEFLKNNLEITNDLYEFNDCVEEFSIQTIGSTECDVDNLEYGHVYIGNGSGNKFDSTNIDIYTRKIEFFD